MGFWRFLVVLRASLDFWGFDKTAIGAFVFLVFFLCCYRLVLLMIICDWPSFYISWVATKMLFNFISGSFEWETWRKNWLDGGGRIVAGNQSLLWCSRKGTVSFLFNFLIPFKRFLNTIRPQDYTEGILQTIGFKEFIPYLEKVVTTTILSIFWKKYWKNRAWIGGGFSYKNSLSTINASFCFLN